MSLIWSKKLELCLKVASVLLKIKFGHAHTDVENSLYQPMTGSQKLNKT